MVRKLLLWKEELHYASKVIFLNVFNIGNTITNPPPNPLFHIHLHLAVSRTGGELPLWRWSLRPAVRTKMYPVTKITRSRGESPKPPFGLDYRREGPTNQRSELCTFSFSEIGVFSNLGVCRKQCLDRARKEFRWSADKLLKIPKFIADGNLGTLPIVSSLPPHFNTSSSSLLGWPTRIGLFV